MDSYSIDNALKAAISGNAILFLGAGIGQECENEFGKPLPNGDALAQIIAADLAVKDTSVELTRIAQFYRRKKGALALRTLLEANLSVKTYSPKVSDFLSLPWRRIYTTNYDNLLKQARPKKRNFSHSDIPRAISEGDHIYINGHLDLATLHNLDTELVLTDWSYANSTFPDSPWANFFRQDIANCGAIIFVGYSMRDLDITRVIISDRDSFKKTVIVTSERTGEIDQEILSSYGNVYATGFDFVAARKKQVLKTFVKPDDTYIYTSLNPIRGKFGEVQEEDKLAKSVYDQFVYGRIDEEVLFNVNRKIRPLIARESVTSAIQRVIEGKSSDIVLTGNIGAGKSFSALDIARSVLKNEYTVFQVVNRRNLHDDIRNAVKLDKVAIIFDNYTRYLSEIDYFNSVRSDGHIAIYIARTSLHELFENRLRTGAPREPITVDLDKLSYNDLSELDTLLNFSGLWNEFAGWKADRRIAFAQSALASSMSRILIRAAQSNDIIERIRQEVEPVLEDRDVALFFVSALILNVLQYDFWIHDWQNFFGTRDIIKGLERHKSALSHFVNISSSAISARAGLIATEILNSVVDPATKIKALENIYRAAMNYSASDVELRHLVVDLMKYSNIESFFVEGEDKIGCLKKYYHAIRNWGDTENRSDYWLQLGITLSIHGNLESSLDLKECELAFKNAYEREKARTDPNLRRIDNYYSRFQLQMAVVEISPDKAFNLFWNGSLKLIRQIFDEETRHYPFKVGKLFTDIAAVHFNKWDSEKQGRFIQRCNEMQSFAEERLQRSKHRDVQFLISELGKLLNSIAAQKNEI